MYKQSEEDLVVNGLWIFGDENLGKLLDTLNDCITDASKAIEEEKQETPKQLTPLTQSVTFDEIWESLESMASHPSPLLSETEFLARFHILAQVIMIDLRIHSLREQCIKDIPATGNKVD